MLSGSISSGMNMKKYRHQPDNAGQSTYNSKLSLRPVEVSPMMSIKKAKVKKRVTFRDRAVKGSEIADVFIVEKIKYPSKQDQQSDKDNGNVSCFCSIF